MKARPRQIDDTKPFSQENQYEKFIAEEGLENHHISNSSIITPVMLINRQDEEKMSLYCSKLIISYSIYFLNHHQLYVFILFTIILYFTFNFPILYIKFYKLYKRDKKQYDNKNGYAPKWMKLNYYHFQHQPYPDGSIYELTEENHQYLQIFNTKISPLKLTANDFEQYIAILDLKSGKDIISDFSTSMSVIQQTKTKLPVAILSLPTSFKQELHNYWKKSREELKRPLLRTLLYPEFDDPNMFRAFRPRNPPQQERKLRRTQIKNTNEQDTLVQKAFSLREELEQAQLLIKQCYLREKGKELERRFQFTIFVNKILREFKIIQKLPDALLMWSKTCFLLDTDNSSIDIMQKMDQINYQIKQDLSDWLIDNERIQKNQSQQVEAQNKNKFLHIESVQLQKSNQIADLLPIKIIKPKKLDEIQIERTIIRESYDETNEITANFLATLYLEAKKHNLGIDRVLNQTTSLSNYTLKSSLKLAPLKGKQEDEKIAIAGISNKKSQGNIKFDLVKSKFMIYRIPKINKSLRKIIQKKKESNWRAQKSLLRNDNLINSYTFFEKDVDRILQFWDYDGNLENEQNDERVEDEQSLKQFRKKFKAFIQQM